MIVLGISPLDKDSTVTLMVDGKVKYAIAEERLSRRKMHTGFPHRALAMTLNLAGIKAAEVDHVVYAFLDWQDEARLMRKNLESDHEFNRTPMEKSLGQLVAEAKRRVHPRNFAVHGLKNAMEAMQKPAWKKLAYRLACADGGWGAYVNHRQFSRWVESGGQSHRKYNEELRAGLREFGLEDKLERAEHHETHVANAFYMSGYDRALVFTVDAYGSGLSGTVSLAEPGGIQRLHSIETPYSLGEFYSSVTSALGMDPERHAGKVVGLAAYGDPKILSPVLHAMFAWQNGGFRVRRSSDVYFSRWLSVTFPKIDLAAAYQTVLEEVVCRYVKHYVEKTGCDTVVLSGGVAANVKMNQRVFEIPGVKRIYIHPNMGDGGCGTGAAVLKFVEKGYPQEAMESAYLGPEYSEKEMEDAIRKEGLEPRHVADVEPEIARLIADNYVVGRFNGRMEYGPRALGNRSILYQAIDPKVNQWLNTRLGRTEFMPFAPATLYEERHKCYKHIDGAEFTATFMTITFDCTPWMIENSPAAVHVDGTARPQLVSEETNPSFYRILREYRKISGLPSVINTSFNMHEEPIVCSPADAVRAFLDGRLDYLAMGNFLVPSPNLKEEQAQRQAMART